MNIKLVINPRIVGVFLYAVMLCSPRLVSAKAPGLVETLSPTGQVASSVQSFSWAQSASATAYRLYIRDVANAETLHLKTYPEEEICAGGTCSVTPEGLVLPESGRMHFRVRAQNVAGNSGYSAHRYFSYTTLSGPPQGVTTISPEGRQVSGAPMFTWKVSETASQYRLHIRDAANSNVLHLQTYREEEICTGDFCSVMPEGLVLPVSSRMFFRVRAQNTAGTVLTLPQGTFRTQLSVHCPRLSPLLAQRLN